MSSVIISNEPSVLDNAKRCKDRSDVLSFLEKLKVMNVACCLSEY